VALAPGSKLSARWGGVKAMPHPLFLVDA